MKAITVKYLPPTNTKPTRIKVQAEGVPHLIFDSNSTTPLQAAQRLCIKFGWGTDLIEGTLPNGDLVFVFNPHVRLLQIGAGLATTAFNLSQQVGQPIHKQYAECLNRQREEWDEAYRNLRK